MCVLLQVLGDVCVCVCGEGVDDSRLTAVLLYISAFVCIATIVVVVGSLGYVRVQG